MPGDTSAANHACLQPWLLLLLVLGCFPAAPLHRQTSPAFQSTYHASLLVVANDYSHLLHVLRLLRLNDQLLCLSLAI